MKLIYNITQRCIWIVTFVISRFLMGLSIKGSHNLKLLPTPLLIISNHRSYWDSMIIGTFLPFFSGKYIPVGFMAADKFHQNFFYKFFFILTGTFPTYKGKGLNISLKYPRSVLGKKGAFLIFPFGKIIQGDQHPFPGRGAAKLVQDFPDLTILPIYLYTAFNFKFKGLFFNKRNMRAVIGQSFIISKSQTISLDHISKILSEKILSLNDVADINIKKL